MLCCVIVQIVSNVVWPPVQEEPELPSACPLFYPPPSQFTVKPRKRNNSEDSNHSEIERINAMEQNEYERINEMCFASGRRSATECAETIAKTVGRQMLVETIIRSRPQSPPQSEHKYAAQPELEKKEELVESVSKPEKPEEPAIDFCKIEQRSTPSKIENPVPKKWESQMLQALTISVDDTASKTISYSKSSEKQTEIIASEDTNILENTFSNIPTKKTSTPLGSALSVAPREPFNPVKSSVPEIIPLPEETVPYFPPENLFVVPIEKEGDSQKPGKKKKDPNLEKLLEDLPKPQQKLSMLAALTTAPDRAFTPSSFETITTEESATSQTSIEKSETETKCTMSKTTKNEQVRPKTLPQAVTIQQEADLTPSPECLPLFQGFTCSFQNKADISQFDIQISTSPMRDRKAKKEKDASKKGETQKIVAKECEENVCSIEKVSTSKEVKVKETTHKSTEKQKQNTIIVKPSQMTSLRKAEELPQYQKSLQQNAEADLIMMERMERAKLRKEQEQQKAAMQTMQNTQTSQSQVSHAQIFQERKMEEASVMCPVITVQEGNHHHPDNSFKPVIESRPPSCAVPTSTPRPLTPSMINKPPPIIPHYQANLVAQKHGPAIGHLLNPRSPGVSRTPSPLPETHKTSLGVGGKSSNIRPKSPAQGPPTNPLQEPSIPTRLDFKLDEAKQSLTSYIPQYKEKMEDRGRDSRNEQRTTMLTSDVNTRRENAPVVNIEIENRYEEESTVSKNQQTSCKLQESKLRETADSEKEETRSHISGNTELTTRVSEKSHSAKAEDFRNIEQKSVERSADGSVQIQRKRVVTEEMEHTRKSTEIVIEKNTSTTNQQGFRNVRNPEEDNPHVIGMHVTAPNPIRSPFLKSTQEVTPPTLGTVCQKVGKHVECPPKVEEVCSTPCVPKFDATTLPRPKTIPEVSDAKVEETKPAPKPIKHVNAPGSSRIDQKLNPNVPPSDVGVGGGRQSGAVGVAPKRGRGVLNAAQLGGRIALCGQCHGQIRGPFITALGKIWCPNHFICATPSCRRPLQDMGFVEEQGQLYCEYCFEQYLAPICAKCGSKIKGDCLKAIGKGFHPECFNCSHCGKLFGNSPFFLEDGSPYCEADWNELFTTKCFACGFPVEAGDRWVEALNNNYHSQCFNCTMCKKNLEGQSFFAKGGRPYCRNHAR
ncbi:hypothetical protein HHI36_004304 [Cryptolaemus montrouzieri]|uniref:LIM zinc-binding domain-containing protein n=1 Tax=Cryptolaemus montrouzieri TaxID=559131 RepID=A0ABD2NR13_9CUCU